MNPSRGARLPLGTRRLLDQTPWPRRAQSPVATDPLPHMLLAALGVLRREPSNPFNDHRPVASARARFPVHAFVLAAGRGWWLDPVRMVLFESAGLFESAQDVPDRDRPQILLRARWSDLPDFYGRLRGGLATVETGIAVRSVALACHALGIEASARLDPDSELEAATGWSCPWSVQPDLPAPALASERIEPAASPAPAIDFDEALHDVRRADQALRAAAAVSSQAVELDGVPEALAAEGIPGTGTAPPSERSWAQVTWSRSSGRMPLGLTGYDARRRVLPRSTVSELARWATVPPPDPLVRRAADYGGITVVVQDTDGLAPGAYRLCPGGELESLRAPAAAVRAPGAALLAEAERHYGYPLAPANGCALRLASSLWLLHASPRRLIDELGPGGWPAAQLWAGWVTHGICHAAGAHDLFARPALSFDEIALGRRLGLDLDATLLMTVTCGTARFREPMLDLRT